MYITQYYVFRIIVKLSNPVLLQISLGVFYRYYYYCHHRFGSVRENCEKTRYRESLKLMTSLKYHLRLIFNRYGRMKLSKQSFHFERVEKKTFARALFGHLPPDLWLAHCINSLTPTPSPVGENSHQLRRRTGKSYRTPFMHPSTGLLPSRPRDPVRRRRRRVSTSSGPFAERDIQFPEYSYICCTYKLYARVPPTDPI